MKAMKGLSMNKMLGSIKRRPTAPQAADSDDASGDSSSQTPEATAGRFVRLFCEADGSSTGDEITYLPPIVESAESSPAAAAECARVIRKLLHRDYWSKPSYQYNAIMLIRILSDNPGPTFTRNLDKKFVDVTKELMRGCRDPSVHQILLETLETFETTKGYDEGLGPMIEMWKKEKAKTYKNYGTWPAPLAPQMQTPALNPQQNYFARSHSTHRRTLPSPSDLANRLEEARTSAKLLEQMVAGTPPADVLSNDLLQEFSGRCHTASASIQSYMAVTDPAPDNDTMESLIDTNEQLQRALNQHQRAVLNAKKQLGLNERSNNPSPNPSEQLRDAGRHHMTGGQGPGPSSRESNMDPPESDHHHRRPARTGTGTGKGKETEPWGAPGASSSSSSRAAANGKSRRDPDDYHDDDDDDDDGADPFRDPVQEPSRGKAAAASSSSSSLAGQQQRAAGGASGGGSGGGGDPPRLAFEPFHPGFGGSGSGSGGLDGGASGSRASPQEEEDLYGAEDAYRANPKKDPVYRY
ncbi:hypothetical protein QBC33DRAFT_368125 [Phialemonium atrogriseum]|uniref:GAT domain-containing protein n=1 Tax=Phialemonium atrogriseum TaxID=1093897 RepID=A0AAJ0C2Z2_9PEZI|nr:uncharacterized protein QBC33DRAFT_368125 [Phialemonium atrogriseum]KAK1768976.1 hypothetical protein QBC33DRAFT_368125 [Phialemonium atrogriseum]